MAIKNVRMVQFHDRILLEPNAFPSGLNHLGISRQNQNSGDQGKLLVIQVNVLYSKILRRQDRMIRSDLLL